MILCLSLPSLAMFIFLFFGEGKKKKLKLKVDPASGPKKIPFFNALPGNGQMLMHSINLHTPVLKICIPGCQNSSAVSRGTDDVCLHDIRHSDGVYEL